MKTKQQSETAVPEGQIIYLNPNELKPHPVIEYLEEHGIFPIGSADIDKMEQSVADKGFLQPIVVSLIDGDYRRIIGRRRTEVAKKLGMTIPSYIREFASDEDIIEAWKEENFVRAQYTTVQQIKETEKIKQIWSRRTAGRVKHVRKCHPDLQQLIEKGVFQMRTDEELITALSDLPAEIQQSIASGYQNAMVVKTEYKDVVTEVVKDPELQQQVQERDNKVRGLQQDIKDLKGKLVTSEKRSAELQLRNEELKDVLAQHGDNNEEIKRLHEVNKQNEAVLRRDIKDKEARIAELERKNYETYQAMAAKIHDTLIKQTNHVHRLTARLLNETKATLTLIKDEISALKHDPEVKEHLLVMKDSLEKARDAIDKDFDKIDAIISDSLVAIEANTVSSS